VRPAACLLLACAALAAGCGNERQPAVDPATLAAPGAAEEVRFRRVGMRFEAPHNWDLREREAPQVFSLSSGAGFVTGFAYPRDEPLPDTDAELEAAERRLVREVRDRDEDFDFAGSRLTEVAGSRAIELRGTQVLSNRRLAIRSVHVFEGSVEYVLEAIAPPGADFRRTDLDVLRPLLRSLELTGRVRRPRGERDR
jgi:hypothetical protein